MISELELEKLDKLFAESLEAYHNEKRLVKILETAKLERDRLSRQLKNPIFDEFSELEDKDRSFRIHLNFLESLFIHINNYENIIKGDSFPMVSEKLSSDPSIKRIFNSIKNARNDFIQSLSVQREKLNETKQIIINEYKNWKPIFDDKKLKFQEQINLL